jgi:hypothetical protein
MSYAFKDESRKIIAREVRYSERRRSSIPRSGYSTGKLVKNDILPPAGRKASEQLYRFFKAVRKDPV